MKFSSYITKTLLFYLAAIITSFVIFFYYYNYEKAIVTNKLLLHTQKIIDKNNEVLLNNVNIETGFRGFLLSNDTLFLKPYENYKSDIYHNIDTLSYLSLNNPSQKKRIFLLKKAINKRLDFTNKNLLLFQRNQLSNEQKKVIILEGKILTDSIRSLITSINKEELILFKQRKAEYDAINQNSNFLFLLLLISLIIIFLLIISIIKNQKSRNNDLVAFTESEKLYSKYSLSLIEASRDPLFTISPVGIITDTNQAAARVTEVSKEKLIGSDFIKYFTNPSKAREAYELVFSEGFIADYPLTIVDGNLTDVIFNGSVYKDEDGNILGAVVVGRDITEQKRIENELIEAKIFAELATEIAQDAKINAESAVKAKQQFLSNMSHEIRTPMNAIIGFTKVVLKTDLSAKQKEYLTAIKMSGDTLIVLINDILDLAKVDAGKMIFEKTAFKLNLSIKAMLHLFETKIQEKNLKLVINYDKSIPEILIGDPVRLHQIILNLVSNAVKFTNIGEITFNVSLISEDEEIVTIKFSISDTGIGIKEDKLESIFDNFQQATSCTSRLFGGTGLGLAIVKQLVEAQKGSIDVVSEYGKGTTFSFILSFDKTTIQVVLEPEIVELNADIKDTKILVVEDMELNQLLMKTLLDDFGFECEIASNGQIAVEKLQNQSFDIVLMDLQMPVMNGFEATEYIRKTMKSDIPIIALTADVTTIDVAKCKEVGMNDYISKPVDERLLYSKLVGLIKKPFIIIEQKIINDIQVEKIKYVDMSYLIKLTKSNPKLISEMISIYLEQTPQLISIMKKSVIDSDWHLLKATVHKMIPSFAIMGMNPNGEVLAKKIHEYASALELSEELNSLVLELENVCAQACQELQIELNNLKN